MILVERKSDKKQFACKVMLIKDKNQIDKLRMEITMTKLYSHPNVVKMEDAYWFEGALFLILEFVDWGSLYNLITKLHTQITEKHIAYIMKEILK